MNRGKSALILCALLAFPAARADAPAAATSMAPVPNSAAVPQVLDLGAIHVTGKRHVAQVLATIKQALKAPDSSSAADRNNLVCRYVHELADPRTYLDCATNATNQHRRSTTQDSRMAAHCVSSTCETPTDMKLILKSLVANLPGDRLHVQVNPYDFKKMLNTVTVAPAATSAPMANTAEAPAAASHG